MVPPACLSACTIRRLQQPLRSACADAHSSVQFQRSTWHMGGLNPLGFGLGTALTLATPATSAQIAMAKETKDVTMADAVPPSNGAAAPDEKAKAKKKLKKGEEDKDADLSEEDLELKKNLELMVQRIREGDPALQAAALESITKEIRSATTSMTSVPKPLKFLRSHFGCAPLSLPVLYRGGRQGLPRACFAAFSIYFVFVTLEALVSLCAGR